METLGLKVKNSLNNNIVSAKFASSVFCGQSAAKLLKSLYGDYGESSETIPNGSTLKRVEVASTLEKGNDIVQPPVKVGAVDLTCSVCGKVLETQRKLSFHIKTHKMTLEDYYLNFINRDPVRNCLVCGVKLKFQRLHKGYGKFCSPSCRGVSNMKTSLKNNPDMHSIGGLTAHKKHPNLAKDMLEKRLKLYPNLSSETMSKILRDPAFAPLRRKGIVTSNKNRWAFYKKTGYLTNAELTVANCLDSLNISFKYNKTLVSKEGKVIPDFFFEQYDCVFEIDGSYHDSPEVKERDKVKDYIYTDLLGLKVIRIRNEFVESCEDLTSYLSTVLGVAT